MKKLSDTEKRELLRSVLESKMFSRSPSSVILLKFLAEATLENKELKETTIGMGIFGEQFLEQNNSSSVRVNIYNLRKKLEKYYRTEGMDKAFKLVIDKGQYYVSFVPNKAMKPVEVDYKKYYKFALLMSTGLILLLGFVFFISFYKAPVPFWNPFFKNKKETIVVVGDFFGFMAETRTGRMGWNRDYAINSLDDFYAYQNENPDFRNEVYPANYSYLTGMGVIGVYNLTKLFHDGDTDFSIRFSGKSSYEDIKEHNSVYVGATKNRNKFVQYFNERNAYFKIEGRKLYYKNLEKKKDTVFDLDIEGTAYEYAVVSRLQGIEGTEQFLFFSDHDIGVIAATDLFCDPKKLKKFTDEHLNGYETFTAVFLVRGKERTNMDLSLIFLDETE